MSKIPDGSAPNISLVLRDTGEKLTGWTGLTVVSAIDAAANIFSFRIPFDPTPENRERFRPYSPGVIQVFLGDERFLLGYIEKLNTTGSGNAREISIEGRSASGAITEWSIGPQWDRAGQAFRNELVFEMSGVTAGQVAERLAAAHLVYFQPDTGKLDEIAIEPGMTIYQVVGKIAAANGYFGVPQTDGSLIYRNNLGLTPPVVDINEGDAPIESISTSHDATKRFWKYITIGGATGNPDVTASAIDSELSPAIRGIRIVQPEQQTADIQAAANMARTRSLIESYDATVVVKGFAYNDAAGNFQFWKAGDVITVYAPGEMIYTKTKFIITEAIFTIDETSGISTTLKLSFPELFSGGFPEVFPWAG